MNKNCGIYKITSPSGKIYIGQSKNIEKRWKSYFSVSNKKTKSQPKLHNSLKKYKVDTHTFEIIEECLFNDLNCRERYWQDFYDVTGKNGLNCILTSCEDKKGTSGSNRKVYNTFYKVVYNSVEEAVIAYEDIYTNIKGKLNGNSYNDTPLVYKDDFDNNIFREVERKRERAIKDIETLVVFNTVRIAAEIYNINESALTDKLRGTHKNNTTLRYVDEERDLCKKWLSKRVEDTATGVIYDSISSASKAFNISRVKLGYFLNGTRTNNTTLKFYEE